MNKDNKIDLTDLIHSYIRMFLVWEKNLSLGVCIFSVAEGIWQCVFALQYVLYQVH